MNASNYNLAIKHPPGEQRFSFNSKVNSCKGKYVHNGIYMY